MSRDDARKEERPIENGITQTFTTFGASLEINNNHNIIIHNNNTPYYTIVNIIMNIIMIIQYHTLTYTCVCVCVCVTTDYSDAIDSEFNLLSFVEIFLANKS